MKSRVEIMAILYCVLELVFFKGLSHTDAAHGAEYTCESDFTCVRYPGANEIVTGSPQNAEYMYIVHYECYEVMTSGF